ncbi:MAG: protein kinase [Paludibacteraceae bacterium]|nr:protein kinase [Paludibacteraceae bacterium]MBQ8714582.1 protein kinase [Prevotella sp.]
MDQTIKTIRTPEKQSATLRVAPLSGATGDSTYVPGKSKPESTNIAGDFIIKGKVYHSLKCLSDNSGEAQVFLVECDQKQMVLKIYYPNFSIKKTLLRIIQSIGMENIVKIYDYGKTYVDGKNRDYELMEYLRGGTLADYDLDGDFNQFRRIALQAAATLAYCHNSNIIHKDIKPSNFFFRGENHQEVVLGDFGISSVLDGDERVHKTTQARTPVYAAPEMYNDVIDGEVEITPSVDYYSLGITLMTLWLGENPLSQNERVMMRKKNEGRLPRINELPDRVKMLIQGLTAVNPQNRWKYEQVERWFLGEDVAVDISSPILKYRSFIVDPEKNLVADNVHELIPLLLDNERLAINYLYNGRIAGWLEQCGNVKLSSVVKDIVVNRYPADQHAGLMAAVYVMEPTYPYKDLHGNLCDDIHSVSISVLSYQDEYALVLRNPNDSLFLYLESHSKADVNRLRSYFSEKDFDGRVAIMRLVYEIDKEISFLNQSPSSTLQEIVHSFGHEECSEDAWISLSDGRLLSWMYCHEDRMACEALRILTNGQKPSRSLGYKVLYNIDRDAAFDLCEADTPYRVGVLLGKQMQEWQRVSEKEFNEHIKDFSDPNGRFAYFAQLHGWFEQLSQCRACFDLKSPENTDRLGVYDLRTAAYRFCRILGARPSYLLDDGLELSDGLTIDQLGRRQQLAAEMKHGSLSQWLSIFYHEDPEKDFGETYSYERSLESWILMLGEIDPSQIYFKRFGAAKEETAAKYTEVRQRFYKAKSKEKTWRVVFYSLCGLWALLLLIFGVDSRNYLLEHSGMSIVLPLGGMSALIIGTRAYFKGYGFVLSCLWGGLGILLSYIPVLILKYVNNSSPSFFIPAILVITLVYMLICHFTDFRSDTNSENLLISEVMDDDVKSTLLEPLYYTFKERKFKFKGSNFGLLDDVTNQVRSLSGESVLHYILWSALIGILLLELILFSPKLLNIGSPNLDSWKLNPSAVVKQLQKDVE